MRSAGERGTIGSGSGSGSGEMPNIHKKKRKWQWRWQHKMLTGTTTKGMGAMLNALGISGSGRRLGWQRRRVWGREGKWRGMVRKPNGSGVEPCRLCVCIASARLTACPTVCLPGYPCQPACMYVCLSACPSLYLPACPSVSLVSWLVGSFVGWLVQLLPACCLIVCCTYLRCIVLHPCIWLTVVRWVRIRIVAQHG